MGTSEVMKVDCRGMQCPAPILRLAKTAKEVRGKPVVLEVLADDADFPNDLEAWCRTARATLHEIADERGVHRAVVALNGAEIEPASLTILHPRETEIVDMPTPPPQPPPLRAVPSPAAVARHWIDLRGRRAPEPILVLSEALLQHAGQTVTVQCDDATFATDVVAWSAATRAQVVESRYEAGISTIQIRFPARPKGAESVPSMVPLAAVSNASVAENATPATLQAHARTAETRALVPTVDAVPRVNQCTILVLRNDFESLMAALLTATTSAAQGMDVVVFFSFWGVNLLRGDRPRASTEAPVSWMQKMMKWMMPKGPRRQKLGKMNMGGMGKGMMELLMRRNNVMNMEELLTTAVEQNVKFVVCTMSMGIMGIQKRDLMDLPNLDFAGVTLFVEQSRKSAMSLVF